MRASLATRKAELSGVVIAVASITAGIVIFLVALPFALSNPFPTPRKGDLILAQSVIAKTVPATTNVALSAAPPATYALASASTEQIQPATTTVVKNSLAIAPHPRVAAAHTRPATERVAFAARWQATGIPASDGLVHEQDKAAGNVRLALAEEATGSVTAPPSRSLTVPPSRVEVPHESTQIRPVERNKVTAPVPVKREVDVMAAVDDYLWEVYQREPVKKDSSGDFTWKDKKAAERLGMSLKDYVIRGMDPDFREQLYAAGHAMDAAGLRWSMLSAFRDDYRQGLAEGIKARPGYSLHGGSKAVGGYGHGRAADIINTEGEDEAVWRWMDKNGAKFGLRRPMPGYDPDHIQSGGDWHEVAQALRASRTHIAVAASDTRRAETRTAKRRHAM